MALHPDNKALCRWSALLSGWSGVLIAWIYSERIAPLYKANKTRK